MSECLVFRTEELLPDDWRQFAADGPVRMFNPGLLRNDPGWIFAYRVVAPDGERRIAVCRLDDRLRVVAGSPIAWSDAVKFSNPDEMPQVARRWFADPRLYRFGGRLFIYWNSGWHEPQNYQFVQELDPATLMPVAAPRELMLRGERQKLEKNWTLFEAEGRTFAIYSIVPHRVLELSLEGTGPIECVEVASKEWKLSTYPPCHGGLRGGTPAVLAEGCFWAFCHSVHDGTDGYRYAPAVCQFASQFPFEPLSEPTEPLDLATPFGSRRLFPRLNSAVGEVLYPCGAAREDDRWLVSHGINDEHCAISILTHQEVEARLRRIGPNP